MAGWIAAAGAVAGGLLSKSGASSANSANKDMSTADKEWQEAMRKTYYQDTVGSMKAAGLNPMLAVSSGFGAQTPSPTVRSVQNENEGMAHSASAAASAYADQKIKQAQIANINSSTQKNEVETNVSRAYEQQVIADTHLKINSAQQSLAQTALLDVTAKEAVQRTENLKSENERIKAATEYVLQQSAKIGLDMEQTKVAIDKAVLEVKGLKLDMPRRENESKMHSGSGGELYPYFPKSIGAPISGAKTFWDQFTDKIRDMRKSSGFDRRVGNE